MLKWISVVVAAIVTGNSALGFQANATLAQLDALTGDARFDELAIGETMISTFPFCFEDGTVLVEGFREAETQTSRYSARYRVKRLAGGKASVTVETDSLADDPDAQVRAALINLIRFSVLPIRDCYGRTYPVETINGFSSTSEIIDYYRAH